jgi:amidophosphoribosyltransferase
MCGIIGLFLKNRSMESQLGHLFSGMLDCMSSRGPDSAGFAIYGAMVPEGSFKVTLQHSNEDFAWLRVSDALQDEFKGKVACVVRSTHAVLTLTANEKDLRQYLRRMFPELRIMSIGRSIEIIKEVGSPGSVVQRFDVGGMSGSHAIGHTRMATESAVTTAGSHPFSTGLDLCLVHNGSLSNHNRLRENLKQQGIEFQSDNDSEVAAGYLTWRLAFGDSLQAALTHALADLDGFYTFAIGTLDGFAVLRDPIACKPAVMAEADDYVAMASEYRALAALPGIGDARVWEPEPATIYSWSVSR